MRIKGYAVKWNSESQPMGESTELFHAGAFSSSLSNQLGYALYEHQRHRRLASVNEGTLLLKEDDVGLCYEMDIMDAEVINLIQEGKIEGVSVRFVPYAHTWEGNLHIVDGATLIEISLVGNPAYLDTTIEVME